MPWFSAPQCRPVLGTVKVVPARARLTAAWAGLHLDPACAPAFHGSYEEPGTTKISLTEVSTLPGDCQTVCGGRWGLAGMDDPVRAASRSGIMPMDLPMGDVRDQRSVRSLARVPRDAHRPGICKANQHTLNPRVRGSSPWRRTRCSMPRSRPMTWAFAFSCWPDGGPGDPRRPGQNHLP